MSRLAFLSQRASNDYYTRNQRLALRPLRRLASLLEAELTALLGPGVALQIPGLLEFAAQLDIVDEESPGYAETQGFRLGRYGPAGYLGGDAELLVSLGLSEGLARGRLHL